MRRPDRARNTALVVFVISCAVLALGGFAPESLLPAWASTALMVAGSVVGIPAFFLAMSFAVEARALGKLLAGEGLITQWIVDADTWQAFVVYHDKLAPLNPNYPGWHEHRKQVDADGVEIVIGEKGVIIDGDYQSLPTKRNDRHYEELSLQSGPPAFVNMHFRQDYAAKGGAARHVRYSLRFPVPADMQAEAHTAISRLGQAYNAIGRQSLAQRNPMLFYRVCLVLLLVCIGMFVMGISFANKPAQMNQTLATILAVVGAVLGLGALAGTIIGWKMSREQRSG